MIHILKIALEVKHAIPNWIGGRIGIGEGDQLDLIDIVLVDSPVAQYVTHDRVPLKGKNEWSYL